MARPHRQEVASPPLDDCFAHDGDRRRDRRMRVAEALALLREQTAPVVGVEAVPLAAALGRVLGEAVVGDRDVPGFDNAAVDGYAFAHADLDPAAGAATRLRVAGRAAAGHPLATPLPPGHAARVLTGAAMPAGADTALMQEDVRLEGGGAWVVIPPGVRPGANRRRAGEDIRRGARVLEPGVRLRPQEIGVAASLGRRTLRVHRRLRVALFSSGDELREPGAPLPPGAAYDSNRFLLAALLGGVVGAEVSDLGILPDRAAEVRRALADAAATGHDAVVTSGGASRGDEDHVVATMRALGRLQFWQVAMKPGRPLALGRVGGAAFVALPGNPVAAMVCFLRFARPVLLRLGGARWAEPERYRVPADFDLKKKPDRMELLRAALVPGEDGRAWARKVAREGSGILTSLTEADGLVEVAEDVTLVRRGEPVDFIPFTAFGVAPP